MRISTGQMQRYIMQGLTGQGERYAQVSQQMVTGNRILKPSDDPLGTVKLLGLNREQQALTQYRANIAQLDSRLSKVESYLQSGHDVLLRVQDLTLAAANGSYSDSDRAAAAQELTSLRTTLLDIANARGEEGDYLFAGSLLNAPAVVVDGGGNYVYQGDALTRQVSVAKGVTIASNDTAQALFFDGAGNFFDDLTAFIDALNTPGVDALAEAHTMMDRLVDTMDAINFTLTDIGGRMNSLQQLELSQEDLGLANQEIIGELKDLNYAEAMTRVAQIELALTATQKTFANINQLSLFDYL